MIFGVKERIIGKGGDVAWELKKSGGSSEGSG